MVLVHILTRKAMNRYQIQPLSLTFSHYIVSRVASEWKLTQPHVWMANFSNDGESFEVGPQMNINKVDVKAKAKAEGGKAKEQKCERWCGSQQCRNLINSAPTHFDFAICVFIRGGLEPLLDQPFLPSLLQIQPTLFPEAKQANKDALKNSSFFSLFLFPFIFLTHHQTSSLIITINLAVPTGNCHHFSFWSTVQYTTYWSTSFHLFDPVLFLSLIIFSFFVYYFNQRKKSFGWWENKVRGRHPRQKPKIKQSNTNINENYRIDRIGGRNSLLFFFFFFGYWNLLPNPPSFSFSPFFFNIYNYNGCIESKREKGIQLLQAILN